MQDLTTFLTQHMAETWTLAGILVLLMMIEFFRQKRGNFGIDTSKAIQLINRENAVVIDLRPKDIFQKGHILDALALDLRENVDTGKKIEKFRTKPLILVCSNGQESQKVAAFWTKKGYNVYALSGGYRAWSDAGLPVIKESS